MDSYDDRGNRIGDSNYLIGRLRLSDCPEFAASMTSPEHRYTALLGCVLKGVPLRRDINDFLRNIHTRLFTSH